ncbi:type III secretion system (T3SS) SseB-like protein [Microbacterium sp. SLBN-154]|uniref:SseB family protein n=1 Tax=Microbacterium sp. SLBN-154 TaxID=2768458 RepID=UPI001154E640|nr:SseB family protein [Microbacterium sp. SLBN-154]TQK18863.1 type III secretion system (T3SS) SseB-like protein [Microbacterium sp. SLBN-154]
MALFGRRKKTDDQRDDAASQTGTPDPEAPETDVDVADAPGLAPREGEDPAGGGDVASAAPATEEPVPHVNISVSTYGAPRTAPAAQPVAADSAASAPATAAGAPAAAPRTPGPAEAPAPSQTVPGLPDNGLVIQALRALPDKPESLDLIHVARQLLQGQLFLRIKGDARQLLSEGAQLPLAVATVGDKQYVLAFSGGAALQASVASDGDQQTSAVAQPAATVLRHVVSGTYAGIIIDPSSAPARAVIPRELIERMLDQADPNALVKHLLAGPRTPATGAEIVAAMPGARLWVAVNETPDGKVGVAEARANGERLLQVFTHPLEVAAIGRGDKAAPITADRLGAALAADAALAGILVDAAGPWIRLGREDLGPILP